MISASIGCNRAARRGFRAVKFCCQCPSGNAQGTTQLGAVQRSDQRSLQGMVNSAGSRWAPLA